MKINKDSLKARANNIAKDKNISQNVVYSRFFFDAFLLRLASSKYKNNFILKGGLYLSSILGVDSRNTMDIDFCLKNIKIEKERIISIITEICSVYVEDNVTLYVSGSNEIRKEDIYGGFQINIVGKLENVRNEFSIDVATGDPIIPSQKTYQYTCLVTGERLPLTVYSLETVISEKLETLLSKGVANSRTKDFYDLYILRETQYQNVDRVYLKEAYNATCKHRGFVMAKDESLELLHEISENINVQRRWESYSKKMEYANGLRLQDVIKAAEFWVDDCY